MVWRSCLDVKTERKAESISSYLNDSNDVSEASFEEVPVNEHAKGEASATVAVDQLPYKPRTWGKQKHSVSQRKHNCA